jgi:hypothetical protein
VWRAAALIAGLVARNQRHDRVATGPRMLGQILCGLADTVAGPRLRQDQRKIGWSVERTRRLGLALGGRLLAEKRFRFGNAVVVLDLVAELQ